jgi:hypothetical protein
MTRHHKTLQDTARRVTRTCRQAIGSVVSFFKNARPVLQSGFRGTAGFTLIEIAFACEVMMLLTLIGWNETRRVREHAEVSACMQYQAAVQRSLWGDYALSGQFPDALAGAISRMPNCSIGNDFDYKGGLVAGIAEDYYLRCGHDHSYVSVIFVDSGSYLPPKAIYNLATARGDI